MQPVVIDLNDEDAEAAAVHAGMQPAAARVNRPPVIETVDLLSTTSDSDDQEHSAPQVTCPICLDEKPKRELFTIAACGHQFCRECLRQHVTLAARERVFPLRCPQHGCRTGRGTSVAEALQLLEAQEDKDKLMALEVESLIPDDAKCYCPNPACSMLIVADDGQADRPQTRPETCPACRKEICVHCKALWHAGKSCAQHQLEASTGEEDKALAAVAGERGWKPCPKCKALVELAHGCYHITCKCGSEWCYKCGAPWRRAGPGGRAMAACRCSLWDENNVPLERHFRMALARARGMAPDDAERQAEQELVRHGLAAHGRRRAGAPDMHQQHAERMARAMRMLAPFPVGLRPPEAPHRRAFGAAAREAVQVQAERPDQYNLERLRGELREAQVLAQTLRQGNPEFMQRAGNSAAGAGPGAAGAGVEGGDERAAAAARDGPLARAEARLAAARRRMAEMEERFLAGAEEQRAAQRERQRAQLLERDARGARHMQQNLQRQVRQLARMQRQAAADAGGDLPQLGGGFAMGLARQPLPPAPPGVGWVAGEALAPEGGPRAAAPAAAAAALPQPLNAGGAAAGAPRLLPPRLGALGARQDARPNPLHGPPWEPEMDWVAFINDMNDWPEPIPVAGAQPPPAQPAARAMQMLLADDFLLPPPPPPPPPPFRPFNAHAVAAAAVAAAGRMQQQRREAPWRAEAEAHMKRMRALVDGALDGPAMDRDGGGGGGQREQEQRELSRIHREERAAGALPRRPIRRRPAPADSGGASNGSDRRAVAAPGGDGRRYEEDDATGPARRPLRTGSPVLQAYKRSRDGEPRMGAAEGAGAGAGTSAAGVGVGAAGAVAAAEGADGAADGVLYGVRPEGEGSLAPVGRVSGLQQRRLRQEALRQPVDRGLVAAAAAALREAEALQQKAWADSVQLAALAAELRSTDDQEQSSNGSGSDEAEGPEPGDRQQADQEPAPWPALQWMRHEPAWVPRGAQRRNQPEARQRVRLPAAPAPYRLLAIEAAIEGAAAPEAAERNAQEQAPGAQPERPDNLYDANVRTLMWLRNMAGIIDSGLQPAARAAAIAEAVGVAPSAAALAAAAAERDAAAAAERDSDDVMFDVDGIGFGGNNLGDGIMVQPQQPAAAAPAAGAGAAAPQAQPQPGEAAGPAVEGRARLRRPLLLALQRQQLARAVASGGAGRSRYPADEHVPPALRVAGAGSFAFGGFRRPAGGGDFLETGSSDSERSDDDSTVAALPHLAIRRHAKRARTAAPPAQAAQPAAVPVAAAAAAAGGSGAGPRDPAEPLLRVPSSDGKGALVGAYEALIRLGQ